MQIKIDITCPHCHSNSIKKNGKKYNGKQNYQCKICGHQFIYGGDYSQTGRKAGMAELILNLIVECTGIRNIRRILGVSFAKIYAVLLNFTCDMSPKQSYYDILEIDEFWTYVKKKTNKKWLICAYHRSSGEIVAYVWGKRDKKTATKLRNRLRELGVTYGQVATDNWDSFISVFAEDNHLVGKKYTVGIEGNNCRLRHRNKRFVRKTCCFSKSMKYHQIYVLQKVIYAFVK
jgi:IS1 family transposase/transposase-like protein